MAYRTRRGVTHLPYASGSVLPLRCACTTSALARGHKRVRSVPLCELRWASLGMGQGHDLLTVEDDNVQVLQSDVEGKGIAHHTPASAALKNEGSPNLLLLVGLCRGEGSPSHTTHPDHHLLSNRHPPLQINGYCCALLATQPDHRPASAGTLWETKQITSVM